MITYSRPSAGALAASNILLRHTGNRKNLHCLALPDYKKLMQCNRSNYELADRTLFRRTAKLIILRFFFHSFSTESQMKTILLYTAALFAVSSALPFYEKLRNQQTSNLCVSLSYSPSSDTALTYVHVCNTPGEGKYAQPFPVRQDEICVVSVTCQPSEPQCGSFFLC